MTQPIKIATVTLTEADIKALPGYNPTASILNTFVGWIPGAGPYVCDHSGPESESVAWEIH